MKTATFANTMRAVMLACATVALLPGCAKKPAPVPPAPKAYLPLAPEGTLVASVYETKGIADNQMMRFLADYGAAANAKLVASKRESGEDVPDSAAGIDFEALKEKELENLRKVDWVAFTMSAPSFKADDIGSGSPVEFPPAAVVYCFAKPSNLRDIESDIRADIDGDAATLDEDTLAEIREFFFENVSFVEDTAAGVPIKKFTLKDSGKAGEILPRVKGLEPCYGLYDEKLLVFASSPKVFADTIALYEGKSKASANASISADLAQGAGLPQQRFGIYGVADLLRDVLSEEDFASLCDTPPGKYLNALRDIRATCRIDGDAMASTATLGLTLGDEAMAAELASLIDRGRGMANLFAGAATMQVPAITPLLNVFNNGEVKAEGDACVLSFAMTKADFEALDLPALITQVSALRDDGTDGDASDDEDDDEDGEDDAE